MYHSFRYGTGSFDISSLVKSTFGSVKTKAGLKDVSAFMWDRVLQTNCKNDTVCY